VKRFGKYRRKLWKDMKNMEKSRLNSVNLSLFHNFHIFTLFSSVFSISFHYSPYFSSIFFPIFGRKISWIVKINGKYRRKVS
jgi:hypothetical protein